MLPYPHNEIRYQLVWTCFGNMMDYPEGEEKKAADGLMQTT